VENFGVGSSVHKRVKLKKILLKKEAVKVGTE
jgi:hypothetical protein